jgi:hypothetical protein
MPQLWGWRGWDRNNNSMGAEEEERGKEVV